MACLKQKTIMCPVQVACDGVDMSPSRKMCSRCEAKLNRRAKGGKPPVGLNRTLSAAERKSRDLEQDDVEEPSGLGYQHGDA